MDIGVATGHRLVGNIGSEPRSKFTAIASAVNLAAQIEGFATPGTVFVAHATYAASPTRSRSTRFATRRTKGSKDRWMSGRLLARVDASRIHNCSAGAR